MKIKSSTQTEKLPSGALPHVQKAAVTVETTCHVSEHVVFHQSSGHVKTRNNGAWVKESLKFQSATVSSPELMGEWAVVAVACPGAEVVAAKSVLLRRLRPRVYFSAPQATESDHCSSVPSVSRMGHQEARIWTVSESDV